MNKTELYNTIMDILNNHKAKPALVAEIEAILKPKVGGGIAFAPITQDGVTYHRCRYTEMYLPESEMVMSSGKSKGYSKKAIAKWTKLGKDAQKLNDNAMKLLLSGDTEAGKAKATEAETLKVTRNDASMYEDIRSEYKDIALAK